MEYYSENEWLTAAQMNTKRKIEQKQDRKEYIQCNPKFIKFENRQH